MTIPLERTNAVIYTETFLYDLVNPRKTPGIPRAIRDRARMLLKHYPSTYHMDIVASKEDSEYNIDRVFGRRL